MMINWHFYDYNILWLKYVRKITHRKKWQNLFPPKKLRSKILNLTLIIFFYSFICLLFTLPWVMMLALVSLCSSS